MTRSGNQNSGTAPTVESSDQLRLYERMVLIRHFELRVQRLYREGKIPGFIHLYVGEEATAVGVCAHLSDRDVITSTHRGHGHALAKGLSPQKALAELAGRSTGCNGGRGGSMHLYDAETGLLGTNGLVGAGIPAAVGAALAEKAGGSGGIAVAFFGDGAVSHGAFHESLNLAATLSAPVVFVCENNLYATSTPLTTSTRNTRIASRAAAYGIPGESVDGNDVLAVHRVMGKAAARAREGQGPTLIEARTYRTVGHHEGEPLAGTYRSQEEIDRWKRKCPILRLGRRLTRSGAARRTDLDALEARIESRIDEAERFALDSPLPSETTVHDFVWGPLIRTPEGQASRPETRRQGWLKATRDAIASEMRRNPNLIYFGEGIGQRGGSFAHTKGMWEEFGGDRMIDTPICELGFTGAAFGAAARGCRAVSDLMFSDFMFEAASQIIQQAAKLRYMSNGQFSVPLLIRAPMGVIKSAGPHHSGAYYPIWAHCPGLTVAVPSNAADAKGLFTAALRTDDPVIIMEPKVLLSSEDEVPAGEWVVPFGQAAVVRPGNDLTLVTCGALVHRCLEAAGQLESRGVGCEVIDLRTIVPLDVDTLIRSLEKTHHLLVVDEAFSMCGLGGEIAAAVMEHGFDLLDAPVGRLHTEPVAHPFSPPLEAAISLTVDRIRRAAESVLAGVAPAPRRLERRAEASPVLAPSTSPAPGPAIAEAPEDTPRETPEAPQPPPVEGGIPIIMPHQDLTITKATVMRWLVEMGDAVKSGQAVVEVETDKALTEIESPADGVLAQIVAPEGREVNLGEPIGFLKPQA